MKCALRYLCREDLIALLDGTAVSDGGTSGTGGTTDGGATVAEGTTENTESGATDGGADGNAASVPAYDESETETLLYCVNAVEDELARYYFPLKATETLSSQSGIYYFKSFAKRCIKILSVTSNGERCDFEVFPEYLRADAKEITVEYDYSPQLKTVDGDSEYDGVKVSENLIAKGAASEFCLIRGEMSLAELWESKYRQEIDLARKNGAAFGTLPPRRWV